MQQRTDWPRRVTVWLCVWLPMLGVLGKDIWLQCLIAGSNPYTLALGAGLWRVLPYLPLHLACLWLVFGWSRLLAPRARLITVGVLNGVLTLLVFVDTVYLRAYNVLPSAVMLPLLGSSTGQDTVSAILPTLLTFWDLLLLADWALWAAVLVLAHRRGWQPAAPVRRPWRGTAITLCCSVTALAVLPVLSACGVGRAAYRRLYVTADTLQQAQYFSFVGFHAADVAATLTGRVTDAVATDDDEALLQAFRDWQQADAPTGAHQGQLAGQNLLVIQFESLESFVLGQSLNGQEITPTLNRLMQSGYTFDTLYEQVKSGNSADCDFLLMTGLLPPNKSYAFGAYADNDYAALPALLAQQGYTTGYYHGASNSVWNYQDILDTFGFDTVTMDYTQDELLNGYLSDASFFNQTLAKLSEQAPAQPFYMHAVTCSSHIPCEVPHSEYSLLLSDELAANPMGDYLQAVHYTDRQLGLFLDALDARGLLDNTAVVVVGDHGGVHKYYPHWVDNLSDEARQDWFLADGDEYTLPMIVASDRIDDPHTVSTVGGQVDMLPTLLGLFGVADSRAENVMFGRDLLATHRSFAVQDDGTLRGTLPEDEVSTAQSMFYLSDLLLRSNRTDGKAGV